MPKHIENLQSIKGVDSFQHIEDEKLLAKLKQKQEKQIQKAKEAEKPADDLEKENAATLRITEEIIAEEPLELSPKSDKNKKKSKKSK